MDEADINMDSFVDIVANTVGMVIILTMLTIARVDERGRQVDIDLGMKMDELVNQKEDMSKTAGLILGRSKGLAASGSGLVLKALDIGSLDGETQLEKATSLLARMKDIRKESAGLEQELDLAKSRRDDVQARHSEVEGELSALRARKTSLTTAMRRRKTREAQLVTDLPGLNMGEFERTPLTSLKQEVKQLDTRIKTMEEEAKIGREAFNGLQKEVEDLRTQKAAVDEELAQYREVTGLEIAIASPPPLREQEKMPVFFECYSKASETGGPDELRVRSVRPGAPPDGEHYRSIADAGSAFSTFLAGQADDFKASHRLHLIVRPGTGAAFRKAREVARAAGWTVGWNPIEKDVELEIGAVPPATTTASADTRSAAARR
ncbi:MAG: hypothetical protein ACYS9X_10315 [Planctomycetota bacterium]|jgi:phage shock protein A